jgi:hypothetical protein
MVELRGRPVRTERLGFPGDQTSMRLRQPSIGQWQPGAYQARSGPASNETNDAAARKSNPWHVDLLSSSSQPYTPGGISTTFGEKARTRTNMNNMQTTLERIKAVAESPEASG